MDTRLIDVYGHEVGLPLYKLAAAVLRVERDTAAQLAASGAWTQVPFPTIRLCMIQSSAAVLRTRYDSPLEEIAWSAAVYSAVMRATLEAAGAAPQEYRILDDAAFRVLSDVTAEQLVKAFTKAADEVERYLAEQTAAAG